MNQDTENSSNISDPMVSSEYRTAATERVPASVDDRVLEAARNAVKGSGLRGFTAHWFRPLAFVATLALSLAIVLELTRAPPLEPGIEPPRDAGRAIVPDAAPADPAAGVENYRFEDAPAPGQVTPGDNRSAEIQYESEATAGPPPQPSNVPTGDKNNSADFADMIEESAKRMQERAAVAQDVIQSRGEARKREPQAEDSAALAAFAIAPETAPRSCTTEQAAEAPKWWQCIMELERAGRRDEAAAERILFDAAYPEFQPPDSP